MTGASRQLLPRLSDDELQSLFRHDERAIWRYQILKALLLDSGAISDVAQQFGTTAETVRTLRSSFLATGHLDALRSKRRGAAGHLTRQTPLAQAVARELAADPTATAGLIWRRVRDGLAGESESVPRRTIYRLVERLRPQPEDEPEDDALWAPALVPALRATLGLVALEPPIDLGRSALAEQLLPEIGDPLARGRQLRALILQALEAMSPPADADPQDLMYRPVQVLVGEALHGHTREELQQTLAIAPATYTRAKRLGLERLAELLIAELRRAQQPNARAAAPQAPPLVGRERDLAYYERRLQDEGLAVIWGLPGAGKSALAATLAERYSAQGGVVWHTCAGAGDTILRQLLVSYGEETTATQDTPALLARVRERARRGGLLVLTRYERIAADPVADLLIATLRNDLERAAARLLIVGRSLPAWADQRGWLPLSGVADGFARLLWTGVGGAALEPAAWTRVYHQTMGFPGLLQVLATQPAATFVAMLRDQIYAELSSRAAATLDRLLLSAGPLAWAAAEPHPTAEELERRGLVLRRPHDGAVVLHPLLQTHRAQLAEQIPQAAALHRELGAAARAEERWLDAAAHASAAGDLDAAVAVVGEHLDALVAAQQGRTAIELLSRLLLRLMPGPALAQVKADLGTLYLALGDYHEAAEALRTAVDLGTGAQEQTPAAQIRSWHRRIAEAYLWMGEWRSALAHAQTSMGGTRTIQAEIAPVERVALTQLQQRIWWLLGEVEQARYWAAEAKMQSVASACPASAALVAYAEGVEAARSGNLRRAIGLLRGALAGLPADAHHNERFAIGALLARCLVGCDDAAAADSLLQSQLQLAEALGHTSGLIGLMLARLVWALDGSNLGLAQLIAGRVAALHDPRNPLQSVGLLQAQAWLDLAGGDAAQAGQRLLQIQIIAQELELVELQARADVVQAYALLGQGDPGSGALYAARAAQSAAKVSAGRLAAVAALGVAHAALLRGEPEAAAAALGVATNPDDDWVAARRATYQAALDAPGSALPPPTLTPAVLL